MIFPSCATRVRVFRRRAVHVHARRAPVPELKIVLAHCGGGGLLLQDGIVAALFCPNIYLELSSLMPIHVLQVLSQVPPSRLMIGSDLPENAEVEIGKILNLEAPEGARRAILWDTACAVFGTE